MQAFSRAADRTFGPDNKAAQPKPIINLIENGVDKLQDVFQTEYMHKSSSRYRWGSTRAHNIPIVDAEPGNVENNQATEGKQHSGPKN
ncbi:hypothetical protein DFH28DRAFT_918157 [Melampsora americana]|nr:hypothetical protein DFH28DRAFT_918157 [Melampsora americana]